MNEKAQWLYPKNGAVLEGMKLIGQLLSQKAKVDGDDLSIRLVSVMDDATMLNAELN